MIIILFLILLQHKGPKYKHAHQAHVAGSLHAVYPLPDNSANALQLIFPSAKDELSQRHGLRLLEKAFMHADTYCLVAQLCFWTEQMKGKIQYMEESF